MKPRILCAHCSAPLQPGIQFCSSCGVAVDWTEETASNSPVNVRKDSSKFRLPHKKTRTKEASTSWMFKLILSVVITALAVIGYEVFIGKVPDAGSFQQASVQPMTLTGEIAQNQAELQALEKNVAAHPNDMSLTLQFANLLHDGLLYEKAISYYKIFLAKNPTDADARVDLGICYKELGDFSEAKKTMKEALKDVPKHLHANFNLGIVCLSEGNFDEANKWFRKTVALDPASEVGKRAQQLLTQHNSQTPKTN